MGRFSYTNKTNAGEWTVYADTKRDLFRAIEAKLGDRLDPCFKRMISRQLAGGAA